MKWIIRNGRVIDPANGLDGLYDILIERGLIKAVETQGALSPEPTEKYKEIDAAGKIVAPGFIDMHVHFREPGFEYKETIATGCQSAAAGGFTAVAVMPNTDPVIDNRSVTEWVQARARDTGIVKVYIFGAITKGLKGEQLSDMADMSAAEDVVGFSDDGRPVMSNDIMRKALEYSKMLNLPLVQHSEILDLTQGGCMNEGAVSTELGLKGMPVEAEDIMVYRDISLLPRTGGRVHVAHISSGNSVELVRRAKAQGLKITCEVAPHHFILTDEAVRGYDANAKMSPPLRSQNDIDRIKEGLADDTIDIIATDHAPHHAMDKETTFSCACFGIVGLETALPLTLKLVDDKIITLNKAIEKLTSRPAEIFGLDRGTLGVGKPADVVIFDPDRSYKVDASQFKSISKNTPFDGWEVRGKVTHTLAEGKLVFSEADEQ
ncbi:MAG: dihydroorotase [Candidatus Nitrohelix vancouverensis]|uniref:Dihydroorotase n=1 Tax=Candidatus Nitrohelix vancouverensis TaxID=2705534 RepID=A0A7T0G445_9BACT|nr:MAG: dihydroorotase [Candidatus Nitrohelix vancouverensis]